MLNKYWDMGTIQWEPPIALPCYGVDPEVM